MTLVVGVGVLAASLVVYFWAFIAHRRAVPAPWTRNSTLSATACLAVVGLIAGALCFLAAALFDPVASLASLTVTLWVVLAAEVAFLIYALPRLIAAGRAATAHETTVISMPPRGPAGTPPANTNAPSGRKKMAA